MLQQHGRVERSYKGEYEMIQTTLFDRGERLRFDKPLRLIELFAGIGAQAKALENLGIPFEHYRICEFDKYAVLAYNSIHGTNFETSDITKITAEDLNIVDTDHYTYLMTYSFPCTDLSVAGKQKGMKNTQTRSGLLWEVERLLRETKELPQILLMENVPPIVSHKFSKDFALWIEFLATLGYTSKYQILNAKDYGIPQNRERCFMVSWLGEKSYDFPEPLLLKLCLCDMLDTRVDKQYYIDPKNCSLLLQKVNEERRREQLGQADERAWTDTHGTCISGKIEVVGSTRPQKKIQQRERICYDKGILPTLTATDYKDPPKVLYGCYTAQTKSFTRGGLKGISRTLKAVQHDAGVVEVKQMGCRKVGILCGGRWDHKYDESRRVWDADAVSPTITTQSGGGNTIKIAIKQATKKGFIEIENGGVFDASFPNSTTRRGRVQDGGGIAPTLMTGETSIMRVEISGETYIIRRLTPLECWRLMGFNDVDFYKAAYNREVDREMLNKIHTRTMKKDEWKKVRRYFRKQQISKSQLYKQAGNSIVVPVLEHIFRQMI